MMRCSVDNCDRQVYGRGFCMRHWKCWRRTGNPVAQHVYLDDEARFLQHVDTGDECWKWTGFLSEDGYGRFRVGGRGGIYLPAHRWAYEHWVTSPGDLYVCHTCDVPACVKVDHLWLGTAAENTADMIAKGRASWQKAG